MLKNNNSNKPQDQDLDQPQSDQEAQEDDLKHIDDPTFEDEVQQRLDIIEQANDCSVLMRKLMQALELPVKGVTQQQFMDKFTDLQKQALEAKQFMQERFVMPQISDKPVRNKRNK